MGANCTLQLKVNRKMSDKQAYPARKRKRSLTKLGPRLEPARERLTWTSFSNIKTDACADKGL